MLPTRTADAVVVGGGTVGAWCAYFLRQAGLARVVLVEKGFLGQGASSRAAGMRARLARLVPVTAGLGLRRIWAATIDYTPDHLPIIGRAPGLDQVTVASAGGAGMMWGPGVARAAADVALTGSSEVLDVSPLGLDRFDEAGHSRLATDPIALPFPERIASS
jgi:glycine/D-amino acid oxidase-like deaminating enzyme